MQGDKSGPEEVALQLPPLWLGCSLSSPVCFGDSWAVFPNCFAAPGREGRSACSILPQQRQEGRRAGTGTPPLLADLLSCQGSPSFLHPQPFGAHTPEGGQRTAQFLLAALSPTQPSLCPGLLPGDSHTHFS